jgi:isoquinoline 1-oxidoreductase alpha subunit
MITFVVNGVSKSVDVPEDVPLLWVLREELGLTGTKYGCGAALCGACTVHLDGLPVRSCVVPVAEVANKQVLTIEGLGATALHEVQKAWIAENVPQCGYCQPGQIMSAVALLKHKRRPTAEDLDAVLDANICRCGTYPRIRRAIGRVVDALAPEEPAHPEPAGSPGHEKRRHG